MSIAGRQSLYHSFFAVLVVTCLGGALRDPLQVYGDGIEYMFQTQALVFGPALAVNLVEQRSYWNATNPFGKELPAASAIPDKLILKEKPPGAFGGLYADRFGSFRYYHPWLYSLAVAPLYGFLHLAAPSAALEYRAFFLLNVVFLFTPILLAWWRCPSLRNLVVIGLLLCSPLTGYLPWQHPELFLFFLVFMAFYLPQSGRAVWWSAPLLGTAAAQNIPIAVLFPLHVWSLWQRRYLVSEKRLLYAASYLLCLAIAGLPCFYNLYYFGAPVLISDLGFAGLHFASLARVRDLFLSPMIGALWFFPACFFLLPAMLGRKNWRFAIGALMAALIMAYLSSSSANLNSAQVGCSRYMVWILAPVMFLLLTQGPGPLAAPKFAANIAFAAGSLVCLLIVLQLKSFEIPLGRTVRFRELNRTQPEVAALYKVLRYQDDPEVLAENISGAELKRPWNFNGIYIWNLSKDLSLWLVSKRALRDIKGLRWEIPAAPPYTVCPPNGLFAASDGAVTLDNQGISNFRRHPVWGSYLTAWVRRAVNKIDTNVPLFMKDTARPPPS